MFPIWRKRHRASRWSDLVFGLLLALFSLTVSSCAPRQHINDYPEFFVAQQSAANEGEAGSELAVTFFGVSSMAFDDGETVLMIEGFFSRNIPHRAVNSRVRVEPDLEAIEWALTRAEIDRAAAVLVTHSHVDHLLDAPEVAQRLDAVLVGSPSTLNYGRGYGLSEDQLVEVQPEEPLRFGDFEVTFVPSEHGPAFCGSDPLGAGEVIDEPFTVPARVEDFAVGETYSVHIAHPLGNVLVHPSAGYIHGALDDYQADVVFLGIMRIGNFEAPCRDALWHEVVEATGATRLVPIHWDDYTHQLDEPLRHFPLVYNDFDGAMEYLHRQCSVGEIDEVDLLKRFQRWVMFPRARGGQ